jgi:hypothetical protein
LLSVLGGTILMAYAFSALFYSDYLTSSTQLETGAFLSLWGDTYISLVVGVLVIVAGVLVDSKRMIAKWAGGIIGVSCSIGGAVNALVLTQAVVTFSGNASLSSEASHLGMATVFLFIGTIAALFVGFPLGFSGAISGVMAQEPEHEAP